MRAILALNYVIDLLTLWKEQADKSKDYERASLYESVLINIEKLLKD